jgi:TPR repeat protein
MPQISLHTASALTGLSIRSIRRRQSESPNNNCKDLVDLELIREDICIPLEPDDIELITEANSGNAEAQNDLAILFLEHGQFKIAMHWLEMAAEQNMSDAMHLLGDCYLKGKGVPKDDNLAIMWIAKAASLDHPIAKMQMRAFLPG